MHASFALDSCILAAGNGAGLTGDYFTSATFDGAPFLHRVDPSIDFDWVTMPPTATAPFQPFAVRWTGKIQPYGAGSYTFELEAAEGARLWIDGAMVLDAWHPNSKTSGTLDVVSGRMYPIKVEHYVTAQGGKSPFDGILNRRHSKSSWLRNCTPSEPTRHFVRQDVTLDWQLTSARANVSRANGATSIS